MFSFFTNISDIPNIILLPTKASATDYSLWLRHCHCMGIRDLTPTICTICKHTWEIMVYMILTSKGRLGPDIWSETFQQVESTEHILRAMLNTKAMR